MTQEQEDSQERQRLQPRPADTSDRILCFAHTKRNGMEVPHTFVRTVKAQDLRFSQVDGVLHDIKTKNSPTWVIFSFAVRDAWVLRGGRTQQLC